MSDGPDPVEASRRYAELAATYERRVRLTSRWRPGVVRRLRLQPGDHVLDVGCGTGANFPHLAAAVGPSGHVTAIDLSEAMAALARTRAAEHGWDNIDVVVGDAATARLPADVDAALFFLVHDLVRSPAVLDRIVGTCRSGAHVVAFGPKWAPRWAWPLNALVRRGIRLYVTTFEGLDVPWDHLQRRLDQFSVRQLALGTLYLADGRVPTSADQPPIPWSIQSKATRRGIVGCASTSRREAFSGDGLAPYPDHPCGGGAEMGMTASSGPA